MRPLALVIDVVAVVIFAAIGRQAHAEVDDLLGVAKTAGPFLAGTAIGTILSAVLATGSSGPERARRGPLSLRAGVIVWLSTVVIGMALRVVTAAGVEFSFVVVATVVLSVFLLGWRLLVRAVRALRAGAARRRRAGPAGPDRADPPLPRGGETPRAGTRTPR